jgi:hypothetical protein
MVNQECVTAATVWNESNVICQIPFWTKYAQNRAFPNIYSLIFYRVFMGNGIIALLWQKEKP